MTTQRKHSMGVSRAGINFVRQLVEGANCTFQEIEQSNDLGNDAYIEFVRDEAATGCCIAVQIKSGGSYVTPDGSFFLPADRHHFEYWASHLLPVCGIVFDPETGRAAWCDITEHLRNHPEVIEHGPFRLAVPASAQLTADTFTNVQAHFARYQQQYSDDAHFGAALDQFAPVHSSPRRVEALRSLFSFHRNRAATWCYVASLLKSMEDPEVLRRTVYALVHLPGHGDIFWHRDNEIEPAAKLGGVGFMQLTFGRDEVVKLLSAVDEGGFTRGSIGQAVHALIHLVRHRTELLESIAFDATIAEDVRSAAIFLYVYYAQNQSVERCIQTLERFRLTHVDGFQDEVVVELVRTLREHGSAGFY